MDTKKEDDYENLSFTHATSKMCESTNQTDLDSWGKRFDTRHPHSELNQDWNDREIVNYHEYWLRHGEFRSDEEEEREDDEHRSPLATLAETSPRAKSD